MKRTGIRKSKVVKNTDYSRRVLRWLGRVMLVSLIVAGSVLGINRLADSDTLPIKSVRIEGTFKYLNVEQLQQAVASYVDSGFFNLNIQTIQDAVKTLGWVDQVSVRRVWPDTVSIRVVEHAPLARWENNGLVNTRGEWFDVAQGSSVKILPEFSGPQGHSMKLTKRYREILEILKPEGLGIASIAMDQRRAWKIMLDNGIELKLGKSKISSNLKRFVRVYPLLRAQLSAGLSLESKPSTENLTSKVRGIDLRYTNGFAIRWQRELINSEILRRGTEKNV